MLAVQPQPEGSKRSIVTFKASPERSPVDEDGPGDGIDLVEVEGLEVLDCRVGGELAARGVDRLEEHGLARRHLRDRLVGVVPAVVMVVAVDGVGETVAHDGGSGYCASTA